MRGRGAVNDVLTDIPAHQISFDTDAFDEAIASQGARLVHFEAIRCPVGLVELGDIQRPHPDHEGCTNGFLYKRVGTCRALTVSNSKNKRPEDLGFWDGSTVSATFERFYRDENGCSCEDQPIYMAPFDRFYLEDTEDSTGEKRPVVVPTWQLFQHHPAGQDRLKYPVETVQQLVDSRGETYRQDIDFRVAAGQLQWVGAGLSGRRPVAEDPAGQPVCAVRYLYRPYWYVGQLVHEIRVSQVSGVDGRALQRMPQNAVLHREYVAQTRDQQEPGTPGVDADALRTVLAPMSGGLTPR